MCLPSQEFTRCLSRLLKTSPQICKVWVHSRSTLGAGELEQGLVGIVSPRGLPRRKCAAKRRGCKLRRVGWGVGRNMLNLIYSIISAHPSFTTHCCPCLLYLLCHNSRGPHRFVETGRWLYLHMKMDKSNLKMDNGMSKSSVSASKQLFS